MDAIGRMAGGIAHDFNNILGIIIGNVNLLKRHIPGDEKALKRVDTIKKSAQRAANLTRQLLGFSRRQAEQVVTTDINTIIGNMDSLITRSITPSVTVKHNFATDLWLADIDPGDFEDALLNLIINARDAMPNGGELTLETSNLTLDVDYIEENPNAYLGEYIQLLVIDNGDGIAPDQQEKIFEPFFTTKPHGKGTGLGLAMVFGFVERSGGYISVSSEEGVGTAFQILLPRAEGMDITKDEMEDASELLPEGHGTILAVDDEEGLLELAKESLESLGYRVLTATRGKEAMAMLAQTADISLLFSDVVMPGGINGYELAEHAMARHPNIKVLLTSGYTEKEVIRDTSSYLTENMLNKPYTQAELAKSVSTVLGCPKPADSTSSPATEIPGPTSSKSPIWTGALSISIEPMDDDHKILFGLLKRCKESVEAKDNHETINKILLELLNHTQTHFRREEAIMAACKYPGLENHQQVHQILINQLIKMQQQQSNGKLTATELHDFMGSWLIDHIQCMDRALAPYCIDKPDIVDSALNNLNPIHGMESPS